MKVTILGCGTCALVPDKACAGFHVQSRNINLMLDCGGGSLKRLVEAGLDYLDLKAVLLSHTLHPDHVNDLPLLLFSSNYTPRRARSGELLIAGPQGTNGYIRSLMELYPAIEPEAYPLHIREYGDDTFRIHHLDITVRTVFHGAAPAVGYRISDGSYTVGYTGDSSMNDILIDLLAGVDLALVECSTTADMSGFANHLNAHEVGRLARDAAVGRLVPVHTYPHVDGELMLSQIRESYDGPVHIAADLDEFEY